METVVTVINIVLFAEKLLFTSASVGRSSGDATWFHCEHVLPERSVHLLRKWAASVSRQQGLGSGLSSVVCMRPESLLDASSDGVLIRQTSSSWNTLASVRM